MGTVYWTEFDWPSFAAIFTGLIAVGGAVVLGRRQAAITLRQAGIAERQNEILASQVEVAKLTLKHELFDRRIDLYLSLMNYIADIQVDVEKDDEFHDFVLAIHTSQFLFSTHVSGEIKKGLDDAVELNSFKEKYGVKLAKPTDADRVRIAELKNNLRLFMFHLSQTMLPEMAIRL